ncbi:unnamed protein product [Tenebrio molitor]|nr:unnamed protein product [Tenebrio molitor]
MDLFGVSAILCSTSSIFSAVFFLSVAHCLFCADLSNLHYTDDPPNVGMY